MEKKIEDFLGPIDTANIKLRNIKASEVADTETNNYTIGKVLDSVLLQKQAINTENYQNRKKQDKVTSYCTKELRIKDYGSVFDSSRIIPSTDLFGITKYALSKAQ